MRWLNARMVSKATVRLQHPVPLALLPDYLNRAVPSFVAVRSVVVEYAALSYDEYDALHNACMDELFPRTKTAAPAPIAPQVTLRAPKRLTL